MIQRLLIVLIISLNSTYAYAENVLTENTLKGHWVGLNKKSIAEFNNNEITITLLSESENNKEIKANIENIADSRYRLNNLPVVLVVDRKQNVFSVQMLQDNFKTLNFKPAPQIKASDINGTWYMVHIR